MESEPRVEGLDEPGSPEEPEGDAPRTYFRRTYDWIMHWAGTPYATPALFGLAFAESSFFPIPPEPLLFAVAFARPERGVWYGLVASVGSVLGGVAGYLVGYALFEELARPMFEAYGYMDQFEKVAAVFNKYNFWAVLAAAVSPIPYKVFTITAGAVSADFWVFLAASILGRGFRFMTEGIAIRFVGEKAREFVEKQFEKVTWAILILLVAGIVLMKWVWPLLGDGP